MSIEIESIDEFKEVPVKEYNVNQINSIKHRYGEVRQSSKTPTFLTYLRRH